MVGSFSRRLYTNYREFHTLQGYETARERQQTLFYLGSLTLQKPQLFQAPTNQESSFAEGPCFSKPICLWPPSYLLNSGPKKLASITSEQVIKTGPQAEKQQILVLFLFFCSETSHFEGFRSCLFLFSALKHRTFEGGHSEKSNSTLVPTLNLFEAHLQPTHPTSIFTSN